MKVQTAGGRGSLSFTAPDTEPAGPAERASAARRLGRDRARRLAGAAAAGAPAAPAGPAPGGPRPGTAPGRDDAGVAPGLAGPDSIPGFGASALLLTADGLTNTSVPVRLEAGVAKPVTVTVDRKGRGARAGPAGMGVARTPAGPD